MIRVYKNGFGYIHSLFLFGFACAFVIAVMTVVFSVIVSLFTEDFFAILIVLILYIPFIGVPMVLFGVVSVYLFYYVIQSPNEIILQDNSLKIKRIFKTEIINTSDVYKIIKSSQDVSWSIKTTWTYEYNVNGKKKKMIVPYYSFYNLEKFYNEMINNHFTFNLISIDEIVKNENINVNNVDGRCTYRFSYSKRKSGPFYSQMIFQRNEIRN